jgi:creatine kinase
MEDKVSSTLKVLSGELKGEFYPLTGMSKDVQQKLIDDHFLFKEGDRFLQVCDKYKIYFRLFIIILTWYKIVKKSI